MGCKWNLPVPEGGTTPEATRIHWGKTSEQMFLGDSEAEPHELMHVRETSGTKKLMKRGSFGQQFGANLATPRQRHWKSRAKGSCIGHPHFCPPQTLVNPFLSKLSPPPQHLLPCHTIRLCFYI